MNLLSALYTIIFRPLEMFFEFVFVLAYDLVKSPALSIVFLSLAMNLLVLPLYRRADLLQAQQRDTEEAMAPDVAFLKKTFHGDERVMILQTYYRQHRYKPIYALRGSLSLGLQIPFFVAAYRFLSGLELLQGVSFGPIADLSAPDGMLTVFGLSVNVLPILMTVINIVSSSIYSKGYSAKTRLQLYGIALVFLVFLYDSPAGLVFYWTLNNLFSLAKNLFYKIIPNAGVVLKYVVAVLGCVSRILLYLCDIVTTPMQDFFLLFLFVLCMVPLLRYLLGKNLSHTSVHRGKERPLQRGSAVFLSGLALLAVLLGLFIPSEVVVSAPTEFVTDAYGPLFLVFRTFLSYIGLGIWVFVFYLLADRDGRQKYAWAVWLLSGIALIDCFFFSDYGVMNAFLVFDRFSETTISMVWNAAVLLSVSGLLVFLGIKAPKLASGILPLLTAGLICVGMINCVKVQRVMQLSNAASSKVAEEDIDPLFTLSKTGKNVVVLMLDRAVSRYIPYILQEQPEVAESLDGFVYYPNTLSFGFSTNFGTPALFGGYEYIVSEINRRADRPLVETQNEALTVMPRLFADEGYEVTVCDPPLAGYFDIPLLSIYDKYDDIRAYNTIGSYECSFEAEWNLLNQQMQQCNFFFYSLFRTAPVFLQSTFYRDSNYFNLDRTSTIDSGFFNSLGALEHYSDFTAITEEQYDTFTMLQNDLTHCRSDTTVPDYTVAPDCDWTEAASYYQESGYDTVNGETMQFMYASQVQHYQINVLAYRNLSKWFTFLKENDVYDNTRIILVSDHGISLRQFDDMMLTDTFDLQSHNSVLLVKDFDASGPMTTDNTFMTVADVPTLATDDIIDQPVNPFTGNAIDSSAKEHGVYVTTSRNFHYSPTLGNSFDLSDGKWYKFDGENIRDKNSWTQEEP